MWVTESRPGGIPKTAPQMFSLIFEALVGMKLTAVSYRSIALAPNGFAPSARS